MSLHSRLDALARTAREAGYFSDAEPCRTCGWPRPRAPRFVILQIDPDETLRFCSSCGSAVDADGQALGGLRTTVVLKGLKLELGRSHPIVHE